MNTQAKLIVGVLVASVAALAITAAVMADGDGMYGNSSASTHMGTRDGGYQGMMGAMGSMDRDGMLSHMREVLGEDGYQRMLAHLADHTNGAPMTGDAAMDQMMHTMMDGMMQGMPMGGGTVLPPGNGMHNESPVPATTPAP